MAEIQDLDFDRIVDAIGPLLGLDIRPEDRPGVAKNLQATAALAALVLAFPLDDRIEPAAVFHP